MGKSEQRELASRMAVLLTHLIQWQFQREHYPFVSIMAGHFANQGIR